MLTKVEGTGLCDLTNTLEEINLSQRGSAEPKPLHVEYTFDSLRDVFSISVELQENKLWRLFAEVNQE